jgi:exodeoxyribonuclease V
MTYTLSNDQAEALRQIGAWFKGRTSPYITLGGYAGTGKTTLIAYLRKALHQYDENAQVAFCAPTGKAARVLSERLAEQKVPRRRDSVSTIHSLIYTAETDDSGHVTGWVRKPELERSLIIVDEASMIDANVWEDLLSFNVPILAVGDHGQLPPVNSRFNLMAEPQLRLERVWRQEAGSPIIEVATYARQSGDVPVADYGPGVRKLSRSDYEAGQFVQELLESWREDLLVLCGYNKTRLKLNRAIRQQRGMERPEPQVGDRVICLRNNRATKVYNGMTGTITNISPADDDPEHLWYFAEIDLDGEDFGYFGYILRSQFDNQETVDRAPLAPDGAPGDLFDFGYALTVHKAQGSQSRSVLLFEERFPRMTDEDWRRWLYTGVTRAQSELTLVG